MQKKYTVLGLTGAASSCSLEKAALSLDIVLFAKVNLRANTLLAVFPDSSVNDAPLFDAAKKLGYRLLPYSGNALTIPEQMPGPILRVCCSALCLLLILLLQFKESTRAFLPPFSPRLNALSQLLLTLPLLLIHFRLLFSGFRSLFTGKPTADTLSAVGVTGALFLSFYNTAYIFVRGGAYSLYYWVIPLIFILNDIGRFPENQKKKRTDRAIGKLLALLPTEAILLEKSGKQRIIPSELLKEGDRILLSPGTRIPADGKVEKGEGQIDLSPVAGRAKKQHFYPSAQIYAGTVCIEGSAECRITGIGENTLAAQITGALAETAGEKPRAGEQANRTARLFFPISIAVSLLLAAILLFVTKDFETALRVCFAVLILSCPFTLRAAASLTAAAAIRNANRRGVRFHWQGAIENCPKINAVIFFCPVFSEGEQRIRESRKMAAEKLQQQGFLCFFPGDGGACFTGNEPMPTDILPFPRCSGQSKASEVEKDGAFLSPEPGMSPMSAREMPKAVLALQKRGIRVAAVGDCTDHAPALAGADLSFSLENGSEIAEDSADARIQEDLSGLLPALHSAMRAGKIIRGSLALICLIHLLCTELLFAELSLSFGELATMVLSLAVIMGNSVCLLLKMRNTM